MIDINAIDRINFAISPESLNHRRFEIMIDKSLNNLIDTQVNNETILGRDNDRNKRIIRKIDHLDSELKLLYKYKPEAEEQFDKLGMTVVEHGESTPLFIDGDAKGWTPIYSKDFRPMCMIRAKSTEIISPSLPIGESGKKKSNVHDFYFNEQDKLENKV